MLTLAAVVGVGYLLGSIPFSIIAGRLVRGIDIRGHGSGNAGAANVLRVLGWRAALPVLLADTGKGWLAVWLAATLSFDESLPEAAWLPVAGGFAAVLGHLWPAFARFRGGKGVATAAGALLALDPIVFAAAWLVFLVVVALTRRIAPASMTAAVAAPLLQWGLASVPGRELSVAGLAFTITVALLIVAKHRSNIRNLLSGTEPKIGQYRG